MRLSQKLKRTGKRRIAVPSNETLKREAARLRKAFPDNPTVTAICNDLAEITDGWVERRGGGEATKPVPLHETLRELWKDSPEPPEEPAPHRR